MTFITDDLFIFQCNPHINLLYLLNFKTRKKSNNNILYSYPNYFLILSYKRKGNGEQ